MHNSVTNPWLLKKFNKDMLQKLTDIFLEAWSKDGTYGDAATHLHDEMLDFFFSCTVEEVANNDDTITIKFKVPKS